MASTASIGERFVKTSKPIIIADKRRGTFCLRLRYTPRKGAAVQVKTSPDFSTRKMAEQTADLWRQSWEQGRRGVLSSEGPLQPIDQNAMTSVQLPEGEIIQNHVKFEMRLLNCSAQKYGLFAMFCCTRETTMAITVVCHHQQQQEQQ